MDIPLTPSTSCEEEISCEPELFQQQQQAIQQQQHPEAAVRVLVATLCSVRLTFMLLHYQLDFPLFLGGF